jgi:hypothetical protein
MQLQKLRGVVQYLCQSWTPSCQSHFDQQNYRSDPLHNPKMPTRYNPFLNCSCRSCGGGCSTCARARPRWARAWSTCRKTWRTWPRSFSSGTRRRRGTQPSSRKRDGEITLQEYLFRLASTELMCFKTRLSDFCDVFQDCNKETKGHVEFSSLRGDAVRLGSKVISILLAGPSLSGA